MHIHPSSAQDQSWKYTTVEKIGWDAFKQRKASRIAQELKEEIENEIWLENWLDQSREIWLEETLFNWRRNKRMLNQAKVADTEKGVNPQKDEDNLAEEFLGPTDYNQGMTVVKEVIHGLDESIDDPAF